MTDRGPSYKFYVLVTRQLQLICLLDFRVLWEMRIFTLFNQTTDYVSKEDRLYYRECHFGRIDAPQYSDLTKAEALFIFRTFSSGREEAEEVKEGTREFCVFKSFERSHLRKSPIACSSIYKHKRKSYLNVWIYPRGKRFIDAVNARLKTLHGLCHGYDIFPGQPVMLG